MEQICKFKLAFPGSDFSQPHRFDLAQPEHGTSGQHDLVVYCHRAGLKIGCKVYISFSFNTNSVLGKSYKHQLSQANRYKS